MSYLRVANVQRGWLNLDEIKTIFVTPEEKARLLLAQGDVLMNEGVIVISWGGVGLEW